MRAWAEMFDAFLAGWHAPGADTSPYTDADYFAHVDGKPRYDGVRDLLTARGIRLPEGDPTDPPEADTVCGLGNRKNDAFNVVLERDGVVAYPGSVALLDALRDLGMPLAVVSSSANAPAVLAAAGLADRFVTVVDGRVATAAGPARQARPRHLRARRHRVRHRAGPLGRRRGCRLRRAGGRRRCVRAGHRRRPRRRRRRAHRRRGRSRRPRPRRTSREAPPRLGRPARPQPLPRRPLAPGRVRPGPAPTSASPRPCSPSPTATSACAATPRRAATRSSTAPTSTGCTRPGRSAMPRRPTGSPAPGRPSSTHPTRS